MITSPVFLSGEFYKIFLYGEIFKKIVLSRSVAIIVFSSIDAVCLPLVKVVLNVNDSMI